MGKIRSFQGVQGTIGQPTAQVIGGSLKIKSGSYLSRTFGTGSDADVWTFSCWIKRATLGTTQYLFRTPNVDEGFYLSTSDKIDIYRYSGSFTYFGSSSGVLRDPGGWQHIVYAHDSNAASGDRLRLYINGVLQTLTSLTDIGSGNNYSLNSAVAHRIGEIDGFMSQCYFVDGQALGPRYFGFTDRLTGTWRPKRLREGDTSLNDGTTWSSGISENAHSSYPATQGFDGNISNFVYADNSSTMRWTAPKAVSGRKIEIYAYAGGSWPILKVNGVSTGAVVGGTAQHNVWVDVTSLCPDGNLLTIEAFGQVISGINRSSGWSAVRVDGEILTDSAVYAAFGNNGFYLPMDDEERFHLDQSGKNNHFTQNNFSGTSIDPDVVKDSPSGAVFGGRSQTGITTTSSAPGNYCTWNPLDNISVEVSDGNLTVTDSGGNYDTIFGTQTSVDGKHYFEVSVTALTTTMAVGVYVGNNRNGIDATNYPYDANAYMTHKNGLVYHDGSTYSYQSAYGAGDTVGVAIDSKNRKAWVSVNGSYVSGDNPVTGTGGMQSISGVGAMPDGELFPVIMIRSATAKANFGQKPFKYAPPQGYLPMNSASARPNKVVPRPDQYVGVSTYSGDSVEYKRLPLNHQPDFTWFKERGNTRSHILSDTVTGITKHLSSDGNDVQSSPSYPYVSSVDERGIVLRGGTSSGGNVSGRYYVAWSWKAGGNKNTFNVDDVGYASAAAAGLTGGDISPTGASVGTKQGFSIITWDTASLSGTKSIDTGLTQAPEFVITKVTTTTDDWLTFHKDLSSTESLILNGTRAKLANAAYAHTFNSDGTISGLVVGDPNWWMSNETYIFYSWHSVPGLQKFGSYKGNQSADGTFVELGFRPSVIMIKSSSHAVDWVIFDVKRGLNNAISNTLYPNLNGAEYGVNVMIDVLSNGFKLRNTYTNINDSSYDYIYAAWAEAPASNLFGGQSNAR